MKKSTKILIGVVIALTGLIVTLIVMSNMQDNNARNHSESVRLPFVGVQEMHDILDDASGEGHFVYIGLSTCPTCQRFEPVLIDLLEEMERSMRYFEIVRLRDAGEDAGVREILDRIGEFDGVPALAFIQNGEVTIFEGREFLSRDDDATHENLRNIFDAHGGLR